MFHYFKSQDQLPNSFKIKVKKNIHILTLEIVSEVVHVEECAAPMG